MKHTKIETDLPKTDALYRTPAGRLIKARMTLVPQNKPADFGTVETIAIKFQCGVCEDETGREKQAPDGRPIQFAAEVHGVSIESLLNDPEAYDKFLADRTEHMIDRAEAKAFLLERIQLPPVSSE